MKYILKINFIYSFPLFNVATRKSKITCAVHITALLECIATWNYIFFSNLIFSLNLSLIKHTSAPRCMTARDFFKPSSYNIFWISYNKHIFKFTDELAGQYVKHLQR